MLHIDFLTALPDLIRPTLGQSILRRAVDAGHVAFEVHDLRDFATDKHRKVDDYPFGGGAGMVLKPEPILACFEAIQADADANGQRIDEVIYLSPDGEVISQSLASELSQLERVVMLCGHYKGVDQRVRDLIVTREVSLGDFVLSGGELPALVLADAMVRLVPGVLGNAQSALSDSFMDGLLDAPAYTRPATFRGLGVPDVLRSGDHAAIDAWRDEQRLAKTRQRRPDLLDDAP
jgi:tRNA (guanine37-N1)-methyltransferase